MANVKISDMTAGGALTGAELFEMVQGALSRSTTAAALATLAGAALNATNLTSGTIPDARFPATLPALSGVNLTALNATSLASGTVPDARFPATLPALSGVNLTALNATNIASGALADARLSANVPLLNAANTFTHALQTISGVSARLEATDGAVTARLMAEASSTAVEVGATTNHSVKLVSSSITRVTISAARTAFTHPAQLKGYTVAGLPAGTQGDTAFVTDALAPTYGTVLTGGGAVVVPAFYNGAAWVAA